MSSQDGEILVASVGATAAAEATSATKTVAVTAAITKGCAAGIARLCFRILNCLLSTTVRTVQQLVDHEPVDHGQRAVVARQLVILAAHGQQIIDLICPGAVTQ